MLYGNSVTKKVLVKHAKPDSMLLLFLSNYEILCSCEGFPGGSSAKESTCQCRRHRRCRFDPWARKIHWRRKWQPAPVFLPGKSHGERSLVTYSPWGCRVRYNLAAKYTHSLSHTHTHMLLWSPDFNTFLSWWKGDARISVQSIFPNPCLHCMPACSAKHHFSGVWLFVTPWTVAHPAPLSMGFSRQESWSGLPFPPPGLVYLITRKCKTLESS